MHSNDLRGFSALLCLVVLSFVAVAGYISHGARSIDEAAADISNKTSPGIHHLMSARSEVRYLQRIIEKGLESDGPSCYLAEGEIRDSQLRIHSDLQLYQSLHVLPAEQVLREPADQALHRLDEAIERLLSLFERHRCDDARIEARGQFRTTIRKTVEAFIALIAYNTQQSHELAERIRDLRTRLARSALLLNALCILLAVGAAVAFSHILQRQSALRTAQHRLAVERADELEQFAGRVAHDILNPLQVIGFALQERDGRSDENLQAMLRTRGRASIKRIQLLLDGLLKFACAGARPEPGIKAEVGQVITELEPELRVQAASVDISLKVEPYAPCSVACSPGILSSLLANLVQNAIKYLGDSIERRITLRVLERAGYVRFEVEDSGPGLPPDLQKVVFYPYVRARGNPQPGFGLGLATVKKATEAHGGRVGVRSEVGRGSLFWFELPSVRGES